MSESTTNRPADVTPHHKLLEPFAGNFKATVRMWMGPGEPHVATGMMQNTLVLGNHFLKQDYQGDASDGPFSGFAGYGFWGYNTTTQKFEGFWIDSASTMMQYETGSVDEAGKVWTMHSQLISPRDKQPMERRTVISWVDKDHHRMESYFTGPDGNETKVMEIEYFRA